MSRCLSGPLALSLLPVFAVLGTLSLDAAHRDAAPVGDNTLVMYQSPSLDTDSVHVMQLKCLRQTIRRYDRLACQDGARHPLHAELVDEYRLIVRETTPKSILRAGLPLSVD